MVTRRPRAASPRIPPSSQADGGYTLAALMMMIMVMMIMLAVAMPSWTTWVQRQKEGEAIFRGLQYAEAIRVFQQRHGRLPNQLEELVKVQPRSIRQLYPNPLTESGEWGLLMQGQAPAGGRGAQQQGGNAATNRRVANRQGLNRGQGAQRQAQPQANAGRGRGGGIVAVPPGAEQEDGGSGSRRATRRTAGPIVGVYPGVDGEAMKTFAGGRSYSQWRFQVDLIPVPVILGGDASAPRVTSAWIGKPFRDDLQVQQGTGPGGGTQGGQGGTELGGARNDGSRFGGKGVWGRAESMQRQRERKKDGGNR